MDQHDRDEDASHRHLEPAPIAKSGEIDGGVTPQQVIGDHPAEGVESQHDLDENVRPVDATADTNEEPPSLLEP